MNYETLIQRRQFDVTQFGDLRVSQAERDEEGGGGHEWLGRLLLCVLFVVFAALSAYWRF